MIDYATFTVPDLVSFLGAAVAIGLGIGILAKFSTGRG